MKYFFFFFFLSIISFFFLFPFFIHQSTDSSGNNKSRTSSPRAAGGGGTFLKSPGVSADNRKKFLSRSTKDMLRIQKEQLKKKKNIALREISKIKEKIKIVDEKLKKNLNDDESCRRWERVHYALTKKLNQHVLENQFPRAMRWMLRIVVPPPEDLYVTLLFFYFLFLSIWKKIIFYKNFMKFQKYVC